MPVPVGAVIVIDPVVVLQIGWVTVTVGAAGAVPEVRVTGVAADSQPSILFATTL